MVVSKRLESFGVSTLTDKPTGRLWNKPNQKNLENRGCSLEDRGNAPCPGIRDLESTESRPGSTVRQKLETGQVLWWDFEHSHYSSDIPERVVSSSERSTICGVRDLRNQHRSSSGWWIVSRCSHGETDGPLLAKVRPKPIKKLEWLLPQSPITTKIL